MSVVVSAKLTCDFVGGCDNELADPEYTTKAGLREWSRVCRGWTHHYVGAAKLLDWCPEHSVPEVKP